MDIKRTEGSRFVKGAPPVAFVKGHYRLSLDNA